MKKINLLMSLSLYCVSALASQASDQQEVVASETSVSSSQDTALPVKEALKLQDPTVNIFPPAPRYVLQGIAKNSLTSFCIINNSMFQKDEQLDEFMIKDIGYDYVLLTDDSQKDLKLKLY
jgi:hypothetical protein